MDPFGLKANGDGNKDQGKDGGGGSGGGEGGGGGGDDDQKKDPPDKPNTPDPRHPNDPNGTGEDQGGSRNPNRPPPWGNNDPPPNKTTPYELAYQFFTGTGPQQQNFSSTDPMTQQLRQGSGMRDVKETVGKRIATDIAKGGDGLRPGSIGANNLSGVEGVGKYRDDYGSIFSGGSTGNLTEAYLGSYDVDYSVSDIKSDTGTATVTFHAWNESSLASLTHPPVIGYTQWWNDNIYAPLKSWGTQGGGSSSRSPMSTTRQNFYFRDTVRWR